MFVSKELSWKRGGAATVCLGLVARRCPLRCQVASVAPASDAPKMEERIRSLCLASTLMGECPELFYLPNKQLDSEMTLDANRPSHSIPSSAESRTSQGDAAQAALHSLVAGVPLTRPSTRPPPTYLALLHSPTRPSDLLSVYQYTQLDFFMGCPAYGSFSPHTLIFDHLANTLASSLLPSLASPASALGTLLPESSSSRSHLSLDLTWLALLTGCWLKPVGRVSKGSPCASALAIERVQFGLAGAQGARCGQPFFPGQTDCGGGLQAISCWFGETGIPGGSSWALVPGSRHWAQGRPQGRQGAGYPI